MDARVPLSVPPSAAAAFAVYRARALPPDAPEAGVAAAQDAFLAGVLVGLDLALDAATRALEAEPQYDAVSGVRLDPPRRPS
jgi:hypothetical protein